MKTRILDCTLRDGGYINNWMFKKNNIDMIYNNLIKSKVDYIEVGYIGTNNEDDDNSTKFKSFDFLNSKKFDNKKTLIMIDYGKFPIEEIPFNINNNFYGIRVAFSKNDFLSALDYCKMIKDKGYNVFIQPMVTMTYSKKELNILLNEVNKINPTAVYIVDSFGSMDENKVIELTKLYDNILNKKIIVGFHSHNNLQLAYSNTKVFLDTVCNRETIIDSSVYGIGRGAGNLATELIANYLSSKYNIDSFLEIVDNYLLNLKYESNWGYCLQYYLSAVNNCHPNYAKYLSEMHTTTIYDIKKILKMISDDKKIKFDKNYIKELYFIYMNNEIDDKNSYIMLKEILKNKQIILIGNGPSIENEYEKIKENITEKSITISINSTFDSDYVFISNKKRFLELKKDDNINLICTSNIESKNKNKLVFNYINNLATEIETSDNSLLMLLNILIKSGVKEVCLAGFDGFYVDNEKNYYKEDLSYVIEKERIIKLNNNMTKYLKLYSKKIKINWITNSNYNGGNL